MEAAETNAFPFIDQLLYEFEQLVDYLMQAWNVIKWQK